MQEYHKINTIYKRDPNDKSLLIGQFSLEEFEYLKNNVWSYTEKIDGTNIRVIIRDGTISFGGRTDNAQMPAPLIKRLEELFLPQKDKLLEQFPNGACLYGEGYGGKIQKGSNYKPTQDFILFDVKIGDIWLQRGDVCGIANQFGLDIVPVAGENTLLMAAEIAAIGFNSAWGNFQAEGLVLRPKVELKTRRGDRIIAKIKCKDFTNATQNR